MAFLKIRAILFAGIVLAFESLIRKGGENTSWVSFLGLSRLSGRPLADFTTILLPLIFS
jgi:hypothetical protein